MSRPLVTVCVPTFNGEAYLAETLASIEAQDYPSVEIIISDDGSLDRTLALAEDFAAHSRFPCQVLRHRPDTLAGNWNFAASAARGEYLKYLFQDDVLYPRHLTQLVASAETSPAVSLVFARRDILFMAEAARSDVALRMKADCADVHRGFTRLRAFQRGQDLLEDPRLLAAGWNKIGEPSSVLIRRSAFLAIGGFDPAFRQLVDLDLYFRLMSEGMVAFVDESLSAFRVHDRQLSVVQSKSGLAEGEEAMFARKMMVSDLRRFFPGSTMSQLAWSAAGKPGRAPGGFRGKRLALKAWLKRVLGMG
jgi:glycosyltransferase involved in cell wall biosynthesis